DIVAPGAIWNTMQDDFGFRQLYRREAGLKTIIVGLRLPEFDRRLVPDTRHLLARSPCHADAPNWRFRFWRLLRMCCRMAFSDLSGSPEASASTMARCSWRACWGRPGVAENLNRYRRRIE